MKSLFSYVRFPRTCSSAVPRSRFYLPGFVADSRCMAILARAWRCRTVRLGLNISYALGAVLVAVLAGKHFASSGWPLADADWRLVAGSGLLFMLAYAFKAYGWHRLFLSFERPARLGVLPSFPTRRSSSESSR